MMETYPSIRILSSPDSHQTFGFLFRPGVFFLRTLIKWHCRKRWGAPCEEPSQSLTVRPVLVPALPSQQNLETANLGSTTLPWVLSNKLIIKLTNGQIHPCFLATGKGNLNLLACCFRFRGFLYLMSALCAGNL